MKRTLIVFFLAAWFQLPAQILEKVEELSWGGRNLRPLRVDVERTGNKFAFYATNESYYPYELEVNFTRFINLGPPVGRHRQIIYPGKFKLFDLLLIDENSGPDYQYSISFSIGDPNKKPDLGFPYLLPMAEGKVVSFYKNPKGEKMPTWYEAAEGDTVFCIRKGIVTASPNDTGDRLLKSTVEIIHSDGTVAVYLSLDPARLFIKTGEKIFAGQPIGVLHKSTPMSVWLYGITPGGANGIEFKYSIDDTHLLEASELQEGTVVKHPRAAVEKEMTKRELKKVNQGKKE